MVHNSALKATSSRQVILVVGLGFLLLIVALRVQAYRQIIAQAEQLTLHHLRTTANLAADQLDGDLIAELHADYPTKDGITSNDQDSRYRTLHDRLSDIAREAQLNSPIYLFVPTDSYAELQLTATSAEEPYWRHRYRAVDALAALPFGQPGQLGVYQDDHGGWLSAFAPVLDRHGDVVAMVQADECFDIFSAKASEAALKGLWWNILLALAVGGMLLRFLTQVMHKERDGREQLVAAVGKQTEFAAALTAKQTELAEKSFALEQSNRDLTDFANVASHDLKSPLRGIVNFSQLLARRNRATLDSSSNEYLDFIISSGRRAVSLVDGLLAYAKSDGSQANMEVCELGDVVGQAIQALQSVIAERGAWVEVGPMPTATCDPVLVSQLFQNLIGNGLKYNRSEKPRVWVSVTLTDDGESVFGIRDNGIGIPEGSQAQVFEMFRRLHGGEEFEGSGIGLAFCTRLVGRYGGRVWLESEEGVGSTFYFTLPTAVGKVKSIREAAFAKTTSGQTTVTA